MRIRLILSLLICVTAGNVNFLPQLSRSGYERMSNYASALTISEAYALEPPPSNSEVALFPAVQDGKHGYIDRAGKMVIKAQFDSASRFSDGVALVGIEATPAYIDPSGKILIKLDRKEFNVLSDFSEGIARVGRRGPGDFIQETLGYIDKTGRLVIPLQFDEALAFSEGVAVASVRHNRGYIDKIGKFVIQPQFGTAGSFSNGLARVGSYVQGLPQEHFIDHSGKRAIRQNFKFIDDFSAGLAAVTVGDKRGYIDRSGTFVITPQPFLSAAKFSDGMAKVQMGGPMGKGGRLGYIDRTGKIVVKPQYEFAEDFSEGLCAVNIGGKYGYIDKTGAVAIQPQFGTAQSFWQGLARVWIDRRMGYIDKAGRFVWESTL